MNDKNPSPLNPHLAALLSGAVPAVPAETDAQPLTRDPAIRAQSLMDVLSLINCPFLVNPLRLSKGELIAGAAPGFSLFYDHHVADSSLPYPGDHVESLEIDVDIPELLARLRIVFNEGSGHYQLDDAMVQAEGRNPKHFSCAAENSKELYPILIKFSAVAGKIISHKEIATSEKIALRRLCDNTPQP